MNQHQRVQETEVPKRERPISEEFRLVALSYVDADAAASLMEELRTATLEKMKSEIIAAADGPMPENKAERFAKSSPDWDSYIKDMCGHRAKATKLKLQLEFLRMKYGEWQSSAATAREEMRLHR
jgi:hypothetical protein